MCLPHSLPNGNCRSRRAVRIMSPLATTVRVKKNAMCAAFVPLIDKKRGCFAPHFYGLPLICVGSVEIRYCGTFCITRRNSAPFPCRSFIGRQAFLPQGLRRTFGNCGTLSEIAAHLQGRQHTFADYSTLSGIAAHLLVQLNCGMVIAVQCTQLRITCRVFKVRLQRVCCILFDTFCTSNTS